MKKLSLLFTGDVMAHDNQIAAAFNSEIQTYDFSGNFKSIEHYIRDVDIAVCNLETTIAGGEPTGYPRFNSPEELVDAIKDAGFSCVAAANNHTYDSKTDGIIKTREAVEKRSLSIVGIRKNPDEKAYAVIDVKGVKVAFFNYTYETPRIKGLRSLNNRPIPADTGLLLNSLSFESIEADMALLEEEINCAREDGAQVIIFYHHWGNEYERHSNVFQKYVAWKTAQLGADAVIGSHAHVPQEISEIIVTKNGKEKKVPVFYGLGNYIWGAPPFRQRETVLHNMLALVDIEFDEETQEVKASSSYVPMYIANKNNVFYTIDLQNYPEEDYEKFRETFKEDPVEVLAEIKKTAENEIHPAKVIMHFDNIFCLKKGERVSFTDFLPKNDYEHFLSEDAIVASVTQNGYIIGNSEGYVGITAVGADGTETVFLAHVSGKEKSTFPVLINKYNGVRDLYNPPENLKSDKTGLPEGTKICAPVFEAYNAMLVNARLQGIYLNFVSGFRAKRDQVLRSNKYAKLNGDEAAKRRYMKFGYSEHHLGHAIDVNNGEFASKKTDRIEALNWVRKNCWKFGFVPRKFTADISKVVYIHLRYLEDKELARYLTCNNVTLEQYLTDYEYHSQRLAEEKNDKN